MASPHDNPLQKQVGEHLIEELRAGQISRRRFLQMATLFGFSASAAGGLLAACGSEVTTTTVSPSTTVGQSTTTVGQSTTTVGQSTTTVGQSTTTSAGVQMGGTVLFGTLRPAGQVDPLTTLDVGSFACMWPTLKPLVSVSEGALQPCLATSWEPGQTVQEWVFHLRETAWLDGSPFKADDVVNSFQLQLGEASKSAAKGIFRGILSAANVTKVDDHTVRFVLDRPYSDFPYLTVKGMWILPATYQEGQWSKGGIGIGPLMLESLSIDQGAVYKKNPAYWAADQVYVDGAQAKFYEDEQTTSIALQGGEIIYQPQVDTSASVIKKDSKLTLLTAPMASYYLAPMRCDQKPFDDKRVRQAMALSMDRPGINHILYADAAAIGNDHGFPPNLDFCQKAVADLPQRTRDIEKAKSLLAEAGYPNGLPVTLTIGRVEAIPQYAQLIQSNAKEAGFDVTIDAMTEGAYYGEPGNEPWLDSQFNITLYAPRYAPTTLINASFVVDSAWNASHWKNEEFTSLIKEIDSITDQQKRLEDAAKAAAIMQDETPALITHWKPDQRAFSNTLHGVTSSVGSATVDVEGMWIEKS
jgi:peptide/nickel transport system substrate-binding protein